MKREPGVKKNAQHPETSSLKKRLVTPITAATQQHSFNYFSSHRLGLGSGIWNNPDIGFLNWQNKSKNIQFALANVFLPSYLSTVAPGQNVLGTYISTWPWRIPTHYACLLVLLLLFIATPFTTLLLNNFQHCVKSLLVFLDSGDVFYHCFDALLD